MIGTSTFDYVLIKTCIVGIRAVTPLSIVYCICRPFIPSRPFLAFFDVWAIAETGFYFFVYLPLKHISQRKAIHPPLRSREERRLTFERSKATTSDSDFFLSKWFKDAPLSEIKRQNLREFFAWAFLNCDAAEVVDSDQNEELDEYVKGFESTHNRPLEPGMGKAEPLKLTLDEVSMAHRPLVWYMVFTPFPTPSMF